ncbi:MAG: methyltransferase domain-containing protein [Ferruginibacter sp.]
MFSNKDIARYYDVSEIHYRRFWNLNKSRSLHYGYWNSTTKNFHEALININKVLSDLSGITEGDKVLDAGCGIGGSSIWLGLHKNCCVTGISLSEKQVATANELAKKEGVDTQVKFESKDFTFTGYPTDSFDVVWAIESVCHAADKDQFIKEAYRLLKPGGRLILADFFKQPGLAREDEGLLQEWASGWAVKDFATIEEFETMLLAEGFATINLQNATEAIRPSAKRLYRAYFPGAFLGFLYRIFYPGATELGKKNVRTAYLQYKCLQKKLWDYYIVLACKS